MATRTKKPIKFYFGRPTELFFWISWFSRIYVNLEIYLYVDNNNILRSTLVVSVLYLIRMVTNVVPYSIKFQWVIIALFNTAHWFLPIWSVLAWTETTILWHDFCWLQIVASKMKIHQLIVVVKKFPPIECTQLPISLLSILLVYMYF